jgi:putative nucleotidyltransferase with HDIG domain
MEAIKSIKEAAQRILKNEIEPLQLVPSVAIKLLKLTNDENANIDDLTRIIETEPTLAAKILRNVNSAAYSLPNKIASIHRAVNILGFSTVRRIALAQLFYNKLIRYDPKKKFNQLFFWQHCLFVASLSRGIALELKHPDPDMVYTAGLIHDIGKIVLETYGRLSYSNFIASKNNIYSTIQEERSFFGLTHAEIGYIFCLKWQIPAPIIAVVACHHSQPYPESEFAEFQQEIAIVAFANYIAWMQGVGSYNDSECQPTLNQELLTSINTDQLNLDYLLQHVDQDMQNTLEFYGIEFPSVYKLRATLVKTSISRSLTKVDKSSLTESKDEPYFLSSLTTPHQSLNIEIFLPRTLKAIHSDFSFDRVMMLNINPKRRCLVASYCWPESSLLADSHKLEIDISTLSGKLLECLREKNPALIAIDTESENPVLKKLSISEFLVVPVKHQERLLGILYADNFISNKKFNPQVLSELNPIAVELGIAMIHAKQYEMEKKQAQLDPLTQLYNKK